MEPELQKQETEEAQIDQFVEKWFKMFHDGEINEKHLKERMAGLAMQMRDPDYKVSGKKAFHVGLNDVKEIPGGYLAIGRCDDKAIRVGEYLNNCRVEKIEFLGREHGEVPPGWTAALTLKGRHLGFSMRDYMWEWSWRNEK
jgi:hypothetical protein